MAFISRQVIELLKKALGLPVTDRAGLAGSIIESQVTLRTNRLKPPGIAKSTDACKISTQASSSRFRTTNFGGDSLTQSNERLRCCCPDTFHLCTHPRPYCRTPLSNCLKLGYMPQINPDSAAAVQPDLISGEIVLWAGQPDTSVIFHKEDASLIPFSLLWGGFAIFWEGSVTGMWGAHSSHRWTFGMLWGVPFVLIGQYLIWGRFFYAAWLKGRTHYAVTNRRVIVVQEGWKRHMAAAYLDSLQSLIKEGASSGVGILRFGESQPIWSNNRGWGPWNGLSIGSVPTFVDIDDVDSVYRLVSDLREKARTTKRSA